MKVALICSDKLPCPPVRGGAIQLLIHETAPLLSNRSLEIIVFSIQDPSLSDEEIVDRVHYLRFPREQYLQQVLAYVKKHSYHLIQLYNRPQWIPLIKKASPKSTLTLSLHNLLLGHTLSPEESEQAIEMADHIITVSKFVAKDIKKRFPSASPKITHLYTGANPDDYIPHHSKKGRKITQQLKEQLNIPSDFQVILYVGRLTSYKGCYQLIKSMIKVIKKQPKTALVIVGSSWYSETTETDYMKKLRDTAKKISHHIYFTNYIPVSQIPDYYTMGDILVCPSQWKEPLARVHYEAMAAGIPIITTNRGGNPEVIDHGKNGFIVDQYDDPKAFAKFMTKLLRDKKLQKSMGTKNRKLSAKKYNFKNYSKRLSDLWKKVKKSK